MNSTMLQLRSLVSADGDSGGRLEVSIAEVPVPEPREDQVLVRIDAAPINPSDLGLLFAGVDPAKLTRSGTAESPAVTAPLSPGAVAALRARVGEPMPVGNEGGGVVVAAGSSPAAQAMLGKTVGVLGGAMYAQYRCVPASACLELNEGTTPEEGASCFVNPLTALGMVGTMRLEGHSALVHTAAASNLGQMLVKLCLADAVPLVNIVRRPEQAELLALDRRHPRVRLVLAVVHGRPHRRPHRDRGDARVRRDRRRHARRHDPRVHGGRRRRASHRVQPLRVVGAQAGVHLRRARPASDRAEPDVRDGVERRRLAPDAVPRPHRTRARSRRCAVAWPTRSPRPSRAATRRASGCARRSIRRRSRCTAPRPPERST